MSFCTRVLVGIWVSLLNFNLPAFAVNLDSDLSQTNVDSGQVNSSNFTIFPVGINIDKRNVLPSVRVRGEEDGLNAINLENWLIPFDAVTEALKIKVTPVENNFLELRSPGLVIQIDPRELTTDPELGLVISVNQIRRLLKVPVEFNINEYALELNPPWSGLASRTNREDTPVVTEGLPRIEARNFAIATVGQKIEITGNNSNSSLTANSINSAGELAMIGTLLDGSWYLRFNQNNLADLSGLSLNEFQYLQQTESTDYVVGSHPTFWQSQENNELWGITMVRRFGFEPPSSSGGEGFNPRQRLQANQVGRRISGEAAPGTLVQLVEGLNDRIVGEVVIDSSGIYRFDDVPVGVGSYRLLLYPDGLLSAQPEVRNPSFATLPGQLTAGDSALIISTGFNRELTAENRILGEFSQGRGGVSYRRGLTEEITAGIGVIHDGSILGLGELFYKPNQIPLQVEASLLGGVVNDLDWNLNARYTPNHFSLNLSSDRLSTRFNADWRLSRNFSVQATGNSRDRSLAAGVRFSQNTPNLVTFANLTLDTESRLRWSLLQSLGRFRLQSRGNEIGTTAEFSYNLSGNRLNRSTNLLWLGYETREDDQLGILGWRYESPQRTGDGRSLWSADLGYGLGSQGHGIIASASTALVDGVDMRLRYQQVSLSSNNHTFRLELVPRFTLQGGINPTDPRFERLRTKGGMLIQPFFDHNRNGRRDGGEGLYLQDPDILLTINNKSLPLWRPNLKRNGIFLDLVPNVYRLDLDPAGFPPDWSSAENSLAVEVVAGSYTPVLIPLTVSYTVTGIVTDGAGKAVAGARVEAVSEDNTVIVSITNGAGVFYLEQLQQGRYNLRINGQPAQPNTLDINESSKPFQELNLQI